MLRLRRWFRILENGVVYGVWTACEHEWYQPIAFPAVRQCPLCGACKAEEDQT